MGHSILDEEDLFTGNSYLECSPHALWKLLREKLIPLLARGSIEVFNFHNDEMEGKGDDLPTRYICNLPNAQIACKESRAHLHLKVARPTNTNILHSDRIAKAAWENGL